MAYISKGLNLEWKTSNPYNGNIDTYFTLRKNEGLIPEGETKMIFPGLQEIGELAITSAGAGEYDQIEVTTLADNKHMYVDGLIADNANSNTTIDFKFLYEPKLFEAFAKTAELEAVGDREGFNAYLIDIPGDNAGQFTVTGNIAGVKMDTVSVNSALTFVMSLNVRSIEFSAVV